MNTTEIIEILKTNPMSNRTLIMGKQLKTYKGVQQVVERVTRMVVRGGGEYDELKATKEGRESGDLPAENSGLPWGQWSEYPYLIEHKGEPYVRFYPASGMDVTTKKPFPIVSEYYVDGELSTKEVAMELCTASNFSSHEKTGCFSIKASNVQAIII
jgi:hypothetical protein